MTSQAKLSVAAPWSLSHYIAVNGFDPSYEALFADCPENVKIAAWDNVKLSQTLRKDRALRVELQAAIKATKAAQPAYKSAVAAAYDAQFWHPNLTLTGLLPGEIELHHTTPFPSMRRPFVFHCETFESIFLPQPATKEAGFDGALLEHYRALFESELCLAIFSSIPETLAQFRAAFGSAKIDGKLHRSRIGLSARLMPESLPTKKPLASRSRFYLAASRDNGAEEFFESGGDSALQFWKKFRLAGREGRLYIHGCRPSDDALASHHIDLEFVRQEERHSIIWVGKDLSAAEESALIADSHFCLILGKSLYALPVMRAMACGAVPIVAAITGVASLVEHRKNGLVTGASRTAELMQYVEEFSRSPHSYAQIRANAVAHAHEVFSGKTFSADFWGKVRAAVPARADAIAAPSPSSPTLAVLNHCHIDLADWPRVFGSSGVPLLRLYTGEGSVTELGGAFVHAAGKIEAKNHLWSAVAEYVLPEAPQLTFAYTIKDLSGRFMVPEGALATPPTRRVVEWVSRILMPYPLLHRFAARALKTMRRVGKSRAPVTQQPYIELVKENVSGMNIVSCSGRFYAVPCGEGAFLLDKFQANGYSASFAGASVQEVLDKISEHNAKPGAGPVAASVELVAEGVNGFNILRMANNFYAIPQGEGAFEYERVNNGGYTRVFSGTSVETVRDAIQESLA